MASEMEAYAVWLREKRLTADHKIQYFVGLARRFLDYVDGTTGVTPTPDDVREWGEANYDVWRLPDV